MRQANRRFEVEYYDTSLQDGLCDVTFELSEDAEDALFAALHREIEQNMREGGFPSQKIHLFKRLSEQRTEHPPWIETKGTSRTYDMELSEWDYHLLSKIVGESLSNVLGPAGAPKYEELVDVWKDITMQMEMADPRQPSEQTTLSSVITEAGENFIEQAAEEFNPDNGQFLCLLQDGKIHKYGNDAGDTWYVCTGCDTSFAEIADDHDCSNYQ